VACQRPAHSVCDSQRVETSDEFVRRMWAFSPPSPRASSPHTVQLAALLARISTDDQLQFGIRTFWPAYAQAS
jgi:hypothetical protein